MTPETSYTLTDLQKVVGGRIDGDPQTRICGVSSLSGAGPGDLSFAENLKYREAARSSRAAALVVPEDFPALPGRALLRVAHPRQTFVRIMTLFDRPAPLPPPGVHPTACVAPDAELAADVRVGEHAVIRPGARIGAGSVVDAGAFVGEGVRIGAECRIGPNVTLYHGVVLGDRVVIHAGSVIGGEGFGYVWNGERQQKIPQLGTVVIEDDVEIGCNTCIDRATFGDTRIRKGVKIDNLVQVAHNDDIGEHSILVAQVGLAGSITLERRVTLGGQVGVADHVTIGEGVVVGGKAGVASDIPPGQTHLGTPSHPADHAKRMFGALALLPKWLQKVREMERRLRRLEGRLDSEAGGRAS
jgi:UDP-3-O-[3-hydroxymyristoyl] glucosamine N-acyltransferase